MYTTTSLTFSALTLTTFLSFSIANPVELRPNPLQPRASPASSPGTDGLTCPQGSYGIPYPYASNFDYCVISNPVGRTTCHNNVVVAKDYRCKYPVCKCGDGTNVNPGPPTVADALPPVANLPAENPPIAAPAAPNPPPANPPNADAQAPTPDCGALTLAQYGDENPGPLVDGGASQTVLNWCTGPVVQGKCVSKGPVAANVWGFKVGDAGDSENVCSALCSCPSK